MIKKIRINKLKYLKNKHNNDKILIYYTLYDQKNRFILSSLNIVCLLFDNLIQSYLFNTLNPDTNIIKYCISNNHFDSIEYDSKYVYIIYKTNTINDIFIIKLPYKLFKLNNL